MSNALLATFGFPGALSHLIAEASMTLEPLSSEKEAAFVSRCMERAMAFFWQKYFSRLSAADHRSMMEAVESHDPETLVRWAAAHSDFDHDHEAQKRAEWALQFVRAELPSVIRDEYTRLMQITPAA